jgi:uncharacterized protein (DUF2267 family)
MQCSILKEENMQYNEFLNEVQQRGNLNSTDEAEDAIRATFGVLARRLPGSEANDLAAQLPPDLAQYFEQDQASPAEPFSLDQFFTRVNEEQGIDMPTASMYVRSVMDALGELLPQEHYQRLRSALPDEFVSMFDTSGEEPPAA